LHWFGQPGNITFQMLRGPQLDLIFAHATWFFALAILLARRAKTGPAQ
jgi:hypothetical protein